MAHALVCAPNSMLGLAGAHAFAKGEDANLLPAANKAAFCMSCRLVILDCECWYVVGVLLPGTYLLRKVRRGEKSGQQQAREACSRAGMGRCFTS